MSAARTIATWCAALVVLVATWLVVDSGTRPEVVGAWHAWHAALDRCDGDMTSAGLPGLAERAAYAWCGADVIR